MSLVRWRHKGNGAEAENAGEAPLARLRDEVEDVFDRFFRHPWGTSFTQSLPARFGAGVRLDLAETDNDVTVRAEVPGVNPKDVEVKVTGNLLTIRGEKKEEKEEKKKEYYYAERQYGSFYRSVELPESVNPDKVDASYKDGVLTITVAKREDAKSKRVPVRAAS